MTDDDISALRERFFECDDPSVMYCRQRMFEVRTLQAFEGDLVAANSVLDQIKSGWRVSEKSIFDYNYPGQLVRLALDVAGEC